MTECSRCGEDWPFNAQFSCTCGAYYCGGCYGDLEYYTGEPRLNGTHLRGRICRNCGRIMFIGMFSY